MSAATKTAAPVVNAQPTNIAVKKSASAQSIVICAAALVPAKTAALANAALQAMPAAKTSALVLRTARNVLTLVSKAANALAKAAAPEVNAPLATSAARTAVDAAPTLSARLLQLEVAGSSSALPWSSPRPQVSPGSS